MSLIPFNKPFIIGKELEYIRDAVSRGRLSGDGIYTKKCHQWMVDHYGAGKSLLTHSCTAALEMSAILADLLPGDEVILPSYTFVSTANAFVLRGAVPVWCDIREDTLNIDESKIESLVTSKTRAIVAVHYAGVSCEMDSIMQIAKKYDLLVIEDAAQGVNAKYKGKFLGTIGHLGCYSFHETKNFISGEGGALLVNDESCRSRAEIIWEKGTNRSQFFRGEVDKYTWVDVGSSFLPSELIAAFLYAQLEHSIGITQKRISIWSQYREGLQALEDRGLIRLARIPEHCEHNAHMFYFLCSSNEQRDRIIRFLSNEGVKSVFHYVPLHTSPMGRRIQPEVPNLPKTDDVASKLLRLPIYFELSGMEVARIINLIFRFYADEK